MALYLGNTQVTGVATHKTATSWNDLEDRPFYAETKMVEILPEQSVTSTLAETAIYGAMLPVASSSFSTVGKYKFILNGNEYVAIGKNEGDEYCIGNLSLAYPDSVDTGEPFVFVNGIVGWQKDLGETITLAIYEEKEIVKKLDPKFLEQTLYIKEGDPYLYTDANRSEKISKLEFNALARTTPIITLIDENDIRYLAIRRSIDEIDTFSSVGAMISGQFEYFYVAEYVEEG